MPPSLSQSTTFLLTLAPPQTTAPNTNNANKTTENVTEKDKDNDDDEGTPTLLLIKILVPCSISVAFLIAVIIFALIKRQKRKEMKYTVKEKEEARRQGNMMKSLPATMASPYDLVGAYAHIDLGTYDKKGVNDALGAPDKDNIDPDQYNGVVPADGLYSKVRKKAPWPLKMRAVDIVEADLGDGEDGGDYVEVEDDSHGVKVEKEPVSQYEIGEVESDGEKEGFYNIAEAEATIGDFGINVEASNDDLELGNSRGYVSAIADECNSIPEYSNGADNEWPEIDNFINNEKQSIGDSD